jgi:AmmeMemoRadiSam system protein B
MSIPNNMALDHGSCVPLYFVKEAGFRGNIVVINYSALCSEDHIIFGKLIREVINESDKKFVFIASGDLSHRLIPEAPAGYTPEGIIFDKIIEESISTGNYQNITNMDQQIRFKTGECAYNSLMVAMGVLDNKPLKNNVLSYEGPFGVGYLVATL